MHALEIVNEANRQLMICNACRYCEGLCPVFRAIETRREFVQKDVFYLANLCHDCRACHTACMYTPPHEFALNIPAIMSQARIESYRHWSWPKSLAVSFKKPIVGVMLAAIACALVIGFSVAFITPTRLMQQYTGPGAFYQLFPYAVLTGSAMALAFYWMGISIYGIVQSWRDMSRSQTHTNSKSLVQTIWAVGSLKHLGGGGGGCAYPDERPSKERRIYHSLVFWGFLCDLASTTLAFVYQDFFHRLPPFSLSSAPVILGSIGGVMLVIGAAGLMILKSNSDRSQTSKLAYGLDYLFLTMLGSTALTGLLTLCLRSTNLLGTVLTLHLAVTAALFITAPYGKFVHGVYRSLALANYYAESNNVH